MSRDEYAIDDVVPSLRLHNAITSWKLQVGYDATPEGIAYAIKVAEQVEREAAAWARRAQKIANDGTTR